MFEFLTSTPAKIVLATTATAAVATGSYLLGKNHGFVEGMQHVLEQIAGAQLDAEEAADNQKKTN